MDEIPMLLNIEGKKSKLQTLIVAQKIDIYAMLLWACWESETGVYWSTLCSVWQVVRGRAYGFIALLLANQNQPSRNEGE